jgi:hypothetical protein
MTTTATRDLVARLAELLANERSTLAEFLVALAELDRRRGWEELGYPSLYDFLVRELGMSRGTAFYRKTAVELVQRFPEVLEPLRDGRLCITAVHALSKAMTPENRGEVLPRFFHVSKQEAKAISAEIAPAIGVRRKDVVTTVPAAATIAAPRSPAVASTGSAVDLGHESQPVGALAVQAVRPEPPPAAVTRPSAPALEPLTATETRLHITVSREFLAMLEACKKALSHKLPGATAEDVLTAGMKLILAQDAKKKALVPKPRPRAPANEPRAQPSRYVPAEIRREVWERDQGRCQWPLASGGICGSEFQPEFDHIVPLGKGGATAVANLRVLCGPHNDRAARLEYGDEHMNRWRRSARDVPRCTPAPA